MGLILGVALACGPAEAVNFDRTRISPYTLEDPLTFADGRKVASPAQWTERREEILGIFAREMYGREPPPPEALVTELADERPSAGGKAIRRQYRMWFTRDRRGPCVNWIVFSPAAAKEPVPVILFLNYKGNHELTRDPDVPVMTAWSRNGAGVEDNRASPLTRGCMTDPKSDWHFPLETILARGYAVMSACYCEISPDPNRDENEPNPRFRQNPFAYTGIFELWGGHDPDRADDITAIGAWAWVLSRGLDLAAQVPGIDIRRSVVTGCSRLGKTALLAAARDARFAVCVPVQTGGGGCPLAKRDFGEDIASENVNFTHWYCKAYRRYSKEPWKTMPFDQHLLLASIAPRALLVQGFNMNWFDPEGEYLACRAAAPVWTFLKKGTMPDVSYPPTDSRAAVGRHLGFVRRDGGHGIRLDDWMRLLDFSDGVFAEKDALTVECADTADPAVRFAAQDLRRHLKGAVGTVRFAEDAALKSQEWRIEGRDGVVTLYGCDGMGQAFAAYAFLEKHAGCRWYAPDTEVVPGRTGWTLPDVSDRGRPAILGREMYVGDDFMDGAWRLRNKETRRSLCGVGVAVGSPADCHTFGPYYEKIKDRLTPEMKARRPNGQSFDEFCPSHPEVRRLVAEQMKAFIREDRARFAAEPRYTWPTVYELSQNDGGEVGCACPRCTALYEAAGKRWSGPNLAFTGAVAEEVGREYPDVIVRTFAYAYTEHAPRNDFVAPDNLAIRYCRSFLFQPLTDETDNGRLLKEWDAHVGKKQVWGYWRAYSGPLFPTVKPREDIGREMRFCRDRGVFGYMAEAESPLSRSFAMLQHWLFLKLAEDPDRDVMKLADEFLAAYYGPAKPAIEKYLAYLEQRERACYAAIGRDFILGLGSGHLAMYTQRGYLDRAFFETAQRLLDEAARLAEGDGLAARHVAHERLVVDRAILENLASLRAAGCEIDTARLAARNLWAETELVRTWKSGALTGKMRDERIGQAKIRAEIASRGPMPVPAELKGREFVEWSCDLLAARGTLVGDADSASGYALTFPKARHRLPYVVGAYDPCNRENPELKLTAADIPADGKFHLYRVGTLGLVCESRLYFDWTWGHSVWLPSFGTGDNRREFWISVKLTGPTYVKGSSDKDGIFIERVFCVKPEDKERK